MTGETTRPGYWLPVTAKDTSRRICRPIQNGDPR